MGLCPKCGGPFTDDGSRCSRCGFRPTEPAPVRDSQEEPLELVEVVRAANEMEAQLIRGLLESHSIPCTLRGEALRLTHSITVDGLAEVRVLVRPEDLEKAREAIASSNLEDQSQLE
jgi:hypothetical protein